MSKWRQQAVEAPSTATFIRPSQEHKLTPYHYPQPRALNCATILLVGLHKVGKTRFGEALLAAAKELGITLTVRTTTALPLLEDSGRPRVDYVAFMIDMTNNRSLAELKRHLLKVDKDYYAQGKSCIIATRVDLVESYAFTTLDLDTVGETYDLHLYQCNLMDKDLLRSVAMRVVRNIQLANGSIAGGGSALFFRSLEKPVVREARRDADEEGDVSVRGV